MGIFIHEAKASPVVLPWLIPQFKSSFMLKKKVFVFFNHPLILIPCTLPQLTDTEDRQVFSPVFLSNTLLLSSISSKPGDV